MCSIWKIPLEELRQTIKSCTTWADVAEKYYGKRNKNITIIKSRVFKENIDISHFLGRNKYKNKSCIFNSHPKHTLESLLTLNLKHRIPNQRLKKKLLEKNYLVNQCYTCGINGVWNGKPLTLNLVHLNHNNYDNRINNLILQCPNCNSQTDKIIFVNTCIKCDCNTPKDQRICVKCRDNIKNKIKLPKKEILQKELIKYDFPFVQQKYGVSKNDIISWVNE